MPAFIYGPEGSMPFGGKMPKNKKDWLILIAMVVLILLAGYAGYYFSLHKTVVIKA